MTTEVDEVPFQLLHLELIQTILSKTAGPDRKKHCLTWNPLDFNWISFSGIINSRTSQIQRQIGFNEIHL